MSDSSRPESPASSSAPPQRHVSGSLKDRIAKFENLGAGSSNSAPIPRPFDRGAQGSYARGGLVGNRLPSLDPKTAGLPNAGPRRVSERRDLIGNRVPSLGNANAAAALAPRHTGGSVGSASAASSPTSTAATSTAPTSTGTPTAATTPAAAPASTSPSVAAASTAGLGLGRPGAPAAKADEAEPQPPQSERSSSPAGSTMSTGPVSTAGSASASATSSALSAPDSAHSGSAPTSATSSPATSPGGALPPQLLVSSLPEQEDSGTMTPLSTRAEAGEEAPSELSMPATPVANNPDLPPPGYDLVPGNLALAAGPQAMASSPSISSSLVSQYDPKSEDAESVNLKDVSNVSTPTGTPRQAHKTLDDDGSIAGSTAGSTRGDRSGPEDVEEKMSTLAVTEKKAEEDLANTDETAQAEAKVADFPPMSESTSAATLSTSDAEAKADVETPSASPVRDTATGGSTLSSTRDDTATTPTPNTSKSLDDEETASPVTEAVSAAVAAPVAIAAAAAVPVVAATTALAKDAAEPAPPFTEEKAPAVKDDAAEDRKADATTATTEQQDTQDTRHDEPAGSDMPQGSAAYDSTTTASDAKSLASERTTIASEETPANPTSTTAEVEELAEIGGPDDENDPPKPDNSSERTTIAPTVDRQEEDDLKAQSPTSSSMQLPPGGPRDRDITPLASQLNSLAIDEPGLERESTPVPEQTDSTQPPPALDDDSDIVSVLGATGSERGDDLHSNRSSMPPARASSELEFRYEDLHERFFRESQSKADGSPVTEDTPTPSTFLAQGRSERDGQGASGSEARSEAPSQALQPPTSSSADGGVSPAATAAFATGSAAVAGSALTAATHSFRENSDTTSAPIMGESSAAGSVVNGTGFPSVPSTELEGRRPVQVHIEPSPHGIIAPHPEVNVEAPSPQGRTFRNASESKLSLSDASSAETSRVPTPAPPAFPSAPGNDISAPQTPSRASTPSYAATPGGITPGLLHSFPPVPDEEHPYVGVHVSHDHANSRVPFPRSVSDRSGLGLARNTTQSLISTPKRTSSLRAPLSPRTHHHAAQFAPSTPPLGSSPSPNLSIESCSDHPPGSRARSPGRKRHSFTPRSPLLDDEDPGDFEPGEAWAIVNRWEPWRAPSQGSM